MKIQQESDQEALKNELMAAQEINFAKVLAGNDKRLRDKAVKKLMKWLIIRSKSKTAFTKENFKRIWTGLFYCMWMSDKFIVQEELAESISKLIHCFSNNNESGILFIKGFFEIMNVEWVGIDQHRIDKFNMLIRRFLRKTFEFCRNQDWNVDFVKDLIKVFEETVLNTNAPNGYVLHFIDIFLEELAKTSKGKLSGELFNIFLEPFVKLLGVSPDSRIRVEIGNFLEHVIKQTDIGIAYEMKYNIWKQHGMPCEKPEDIELSIDEEMDEDENEYDKAESALDPRAGKVDVFLPQIAVDIDGILSMIRKTIHSHATSTRGRKALKRMEKKFETLKSGNMPEYIRKPEILDVKKDKKFTKKCVRDLMEFTERLNQRDDDDGDIEMTCNEIDSDDDEDDDLNGDNDDDNDSELDKPVAKIRNKTKKGKGSDIENSVSSKVKKKAKLDKGAKKEKVNERNGEKPKNVKTKSLKKDASPKCKSPKDQFKVEDVSKESVTLGVTPKKRKALSEWQVLEMDSEEINKITVPKIIKLETKERVSPVENKQERNGDDSRPVKVVTPVKLTPCFWDKAKEKAFKKRNSTGSSALVNPLSPVVNSKNSNKRISFALDRNQAQEIDEYLEEVKNSPSIPFDGSKNPIQSALKAGLPQSPINPFYRFKKIK